MRKFASLTSLACCAAAIFVNELSAAVSGLPGQEPAAMRVRMKQRPQVTVGLRSGDIVGADNRALQAAVDYVAGLGGGVVLVGPGEFRMRDSLHLRNNVTVRGTPNATIFRKEPGAVSPLKVDGDYGEEQVTLERPGGFQIGDGIAVWDKNSGGFHTTVARVIGRDGDIFAISLPLNADCMVANGAQAATVFPVISGYHVQGARVEDIIVDGNKDANVSLNGCRGAGIFLYRCHGAVIERCTARNYHGDGISFQQSNDVQVLGCHSESNNGLGLHPGSGSQRPVIRDCVARNNQEDGLFLCWRVQHGVFEGNILEGNRRFGISIGHKDTDNLLRLNQVRSNYQAGVFFRNETLGMAGHRNRLEENVIENNGVSSPAPGIRVRGETHDLLFRNNTIRDTRSEAERLQTIGIHLEQNVGTVNLEQNRVDAAQPLKDERNSAR